MSAAHCCRLVLGIALAIAILDATATATASELASAEEMPTEGLTTAGATPLAGVGTDGTPLRAFCTDRPTKANLPCILDEGHWQVESDAVNYTFERGAHAVLFTNPTVKYGLTGDADLEVNWTPYEEVHGYDTERRQEITRYGVGDLVLRAKLGLLGQDGGWAAATLIPYVKVPTAPTIIGNGVWEGGLIVPVLFKLNDQLCLTLDPEVDALKNSDRGGRHAAVAQVVNLGWSLPHGVTVFGEIWSYVNIDPAGTVTQYSGDVALAWGLPRDFQLDVGANIGLNRQTPAAQVYAGVSQRF
jgi:hypothetical protein